MQKIELSSRRTVSITEGWRGSRSKPPQFITGPRRLRQMRRFAAVDGSSLCRESLIIVKCQCDQISNQISARALQHSDAQVLRVNFLIKFNHLSKHGWARLVFCCFAFAGIRSDRSTVSVPLLQAHSLMTLWWGIWASSRGYMFLSFAYHLNECRISTFLIHQLSPLTFCGHSSPLKFHLR